MTAPILAGAAPWVAATSASHDFGLFRKADADAPWQRITRGLPEAVQIRFIETAADGTLYAGAQDGPYRSTDAGESWTRLGLDRNEVVWSILVHPADPKVLYVGTVEQGVYRSDDGGASFRALAPAAPEGLCRMGFPTRVIRLAVDPGHPDELYVALEVGGLLRSLDGGRSFESCNRALLEMAGERRYQSRIGSDRDSEGMMDSHALALSPARPGTVFLANRMGLFRSDDRGENWTDLAIGRFSPLTYARDVKVSPHDARTLLGAFSLASVSDAGSLWRSTDLGESWQRFDHDVDMQSTLMIIAPSQRDAQRVYCGARRGQVFGTEDGGATWATLPLPTGVQGVYALACL